MATGPKHPKRPRDLYQWAKRMVDIASGEVEDRGTVAPGAGWLRPVAMGTL
jgi:hypothetical protein